MNISVSSTFFDADENCSNIAILQMPSLQPTRSLVLVAGSGAETVFLRTQVVREPVPSR